MAGASPHPERGVTAPWDVAAVRREFPILTRQVHGRPLVYLDNAATSHKPRAVLEAERRFYTVTNANIHRGVHRLAEEATAAYEGAREEIARLLGASHSREVVFVRGATEGINLVAQAFLRPRLQPGDEVLVTAMEHHANIVPWQMVCRERGARLRVIPVDDRGVLDLDALPDMLGDRARLLAFTWVSNALGTVNPVAEMIAAARRRGVPVLVDGAQAIPHLAVDVGSLGADFLVFSGHKVYGPTGIGVLWGRGEVLEAMDPYQGGGDMIRSVTFERTEFNDIPHRFEAGTPHMAGAVGLATALRFLAELDVEAVAAHEHMLLELATAALAEIPKLRIIGQAPNKAAVVSFHFEDVHPHDVATILDMEGVAVRAGHHCAQPLMERFGVPATARASFALYNTAVEVEALAAGLRRVREVFG